MKLPRSLFQIPAVISVLCCIALANWIAARFPLRLDLTEEKLYTIAPGTERILASLPAQVTIHVCFSKNLPPSVSRIETATRDMLSELAIRAHGKLRVEWIDPSGNDSIRQSLQALGIPGIQLQTYERDKTAVTEILLGMIVSSGSREEIIPVVQDIGNLEYTFMQAVQKTVTATRPAVGILLDGDLPHIDPATARQMGIPVDPAYMRFDFIKSILSQSCDARLINGSSLADTALKAVVVPGTPDSSFSDSTLIAIEHFVNRGGHLVVLADAAHIDLSQGPVARAQHGRILDMLSFWGVSVESALLLDPSCGQISVPQTINGMQMNLPVEYPPVVYITPEGLNQNDPVVSSLGQMIFTFANPIRILDSSRTTTLVSSSVNSWVDRTSFNLDPGQDWKSIYAANFGSCASFPLIVRIDGPFPNWENAGCPPHADSSIKASADAASLSMHETSGTVTVTGGSTFLTAPDNAAPGNVSWLLNTVESTTGNRDLLAIRSRSLASRALDSDQLLQDRSYAGIIRFVNIALLPGLLILFGVLHTIRRKKRQQRASIKNRPPALPPAPLTTDTSDEDTRSCT